MHMPTTVIPATPFAMLRRIGSAVVQLLTFTGNSMAGRYGSPPEDSHDVIDEETMRAVALICAAHF
jgi:hypothetical protein